MKRFALFLLGVLLSAPAGAASTYHIKFGLATGANNGTSKADAWRDWGSLNWTTLTTGLPNVLCIYGAQTATQAFAGNGSSDAARLTLKYDCDPSDPGYLLIASGSCYSSTTSRSYVSFVGLDVRGFTGTCLDVRSAAAVRFVNGRIVGASVAQGGDTSLIIGSGATITGFRTKFANIATRGCVACYLYDIVIDSAGERGSSGNQDGLALDDDLASVGCEGAVLDNITVLNQGSSQGSGIDFQCSFGTGKVTARNLFVHASEGVGITVGSNATLTHDISASVSAANGSNAWYQKTNGTQATYSHIVGVQPDGNANSAFRFGDGSSTGMVASVVNSILSGDSQTMALTNASGTLTDHHNDYDGPLYSTTNGTRTLAQWISDGQCAAGGCSSAAPRFVGGPIPSTRNGFQLIPASQLCGVGAPVRPRARDGLGRLFDRYRPAMGAFECARVPTSRAAR